MKASENTRKNILDAIERDLDPSYARVFSHLLFSFALGGSFSLLFCGQFGFGFSGFATHFNHTVHLQVGPLVCSLICGAIFAFFPVFILKLISHPLLFQKIIEKYHFLKAGFIFSISLLVYSHGYFEVEMTHTLLWSLSAYCLFKFIGFNLQSQSFQQIA